MRPTLDFLQTAQQQIHSTLETLRPKLLAAQGSIAHRMKDDRSPVTAMDLLVERCLRENLARLDHAIGFGGEEGGVDYSQKTFWLVDPIDGTEPFIRGIPIAANMIALIDNNEPVMGVIYNFSTDEYFLAIKGHGATCNNRPIHVGNRPLGHAWVTLGMQSGRPGAAGLSDQLSQLVYRVRNFGNSAFDFSLIARGSIEGRIHFGGKACEWDFAPGALIVQEAGGRVANIGSDGYDYRKLDHIAANPVIFDELMKFMNGVVEHA
ncbi:MAG TPA: inositol monophosphatase [Candidatus Saccharimonadales bacterium]|nr:inositol monophosphatase [Candidatus Saccharimonadales bacterium]